MNGKYTLLTAGILGAAAVGLGAFGAHGLEAFLEAAGRTDTYETAVKYHFYHSLFLFGLGILRVQFPDLPHLKTAIHFTMAGILIFSGSLYFLCLSGITWLGAITPIGGVLLIVAWLLMGVGSWKYFR